MFARSLIRRYAGSDTATEQLERQAEIDRPDDIRHGRIGARCTFEIETVQESARRSSSGKPSRLTVSISSSPSRMLLATPSAVRYKKWKMYYSMTASGAAGWTDPIIKYHWTIVANIKRDSITAMIVLSCSREVRDLLASKSCDMGRSVSLLRSAKGALPRRPPHSICT